MSLEIKDIGVKLGKTTILEQVSLITDEGEVVALLGLNGAGKTTLIKTIAGLIPSYQGVVCVEAMNMNQLSLRERAKRIAYVPQQLNTPFDYEVEDFVLMGVTPYLGVFESPKVMHRKKVVEVLEQLQIGHLRKKNLLFLSGGEKQMVYLARAMVQEAKVMVLDEPTAYLDFKRQHEFLGYLRKLMQESKKTAVISVHDPNLALQYADKIVIIHDKNVLATVHRGEKRQLQQALDVLYDGKANLMETQEHTLVIYQQ
ncbi:MAG: ABC transporter ATP-binding protein [Cellulosilyticaceae bacterium]